MYGGFLKREYPNCWMVYNGNLQIIFLKKKHDLGIFPFQDTSNYKCEYYIYIIYV